MNDDQAVDKALAQVERNDDGDVPEKRLVDLVAELLDPVDVEAEKRERAAKLVKARQERGYRRDGLIHLPGIDPYDYEPDRLLKDGDGNLVEKSKARPRHTAAGVKRMRNQLARLVAGATRYGDENDRFNQWALDAQRDGLDWDRIVFDTFIHDAGLWEPAPEESEGDETDG